MIDWIRRLFYREDRDIARAARRYREWLDENRGFTLGAGERVTGTMIIPRGSEVYVRWECGECGRRWRKFIGIADPNLIGNSHFEADIACPSCDRDNAAAMGVTSDDGDYPGEAGIL